MERVVHIGGRDVVFLAGALQEPTGWRPAVQYWSTGRDFEPAMSTISNGTLPGYQAALSVALALAANKIKVLRANPSLSCAETCDIEEPHEPEAAIAAVGQAPPATGGAARDDNGGAEPPSGGKQRAPDDYTPRKPMLRSEEVRRGLRHLYRDMESFSDRDDHW